MKKVIIQSDSYDISTDSIINWLYYLNPNIEILKLFNEHRIKDFILKLSNSEELNLSINGGKISYLDKYWYRRGRFSFDNYFLSDDFSQFEKKAARENLTKILEFIQNIQFKNAINKYSDNKIDKLEMLNCCKKCDLKIPDTIVTNSYIKLKYFIRKHKQVISKPIQYPILEYEQYNETIFFSTKTELVTEENLDSFSSSFLPSLFQQYIDKKFEIRSFFINEKFYSMAIFSQENPKTKIDFRDYDYERPNRTVPFKLPQKIEKKLSNLMKNLNMNSGSLDIIYTPNHEYVFLEVNPVGQFQWLSYHCNYFIEKIVAKILIDE